MTDATRYTSRLTAAIALSMLLWVPTQLLAGDDTDSVIVHKQCVPDDAGGVFEITLLDDGGDPAIADQNPISIGCGESATFTGVEEGTYSAVEAILQGDFEETSNDCQGLDLDVAFPPPECTIVNEAPAPGSITIVKETEGGDGTFGFVSSQLGAFTITTAGGSGDMVFGDLPPGTYEIMENVPVGWTFTGIFCEQGDQTVIVIDPQNASVAIDLPQGDDVTCTFNNARETGAVVIQKQSSGGDGSFNFTGDLGDFVITTAGGTGSETFADAAPGTYNVTEIVPAGWELAALVCDDNDSTTDLGTQTATIELSAGETVTCTFTNRPEQQPDTGTIIINKQAAGGDGVTFDFTSDLGDFGITLVGESGSATFPDLAPGTYAVTEIVPAGWELAALSCDDGDSTVDLGSATVTIELAASEIVNCTFTNRALAEPTTTITIVKTATDGDGETFSFTGDLGDFDITIAGISGSQTFPDMPAGTYHVTEIVPAGWTLAVLSCDNDDSSIDLASATATIVVTANDIHVSCFFTNREEAALIEPAAIPALSRPALMTLVLLLLLAAFWKMIPGHRH